MKFTTHPTVKRSHLEHSTMARSRRTGLIGLAVLAVSSLGLDGRAAWAQSRQISAGAAAQIQALMAEKASRTPAQRKVASNLLYEAKRRRRDARMAQVPSLQTGVVVATDGTTEVDIRADVTAALLAQIQTAGGTVLSSHPKFRAIRARVPVGAIETLAASPDVDAIAEAEQAVVNKVDTSEGDVAHRADVARAAFGADGTGVKLCAMSDSIDSLAALQASGDLPAVDVLAGQSGNPGTSEGTAMLEILFDLAPGASLGFGTASGGRAQFAQNILDLRFVLNCDVIVDDVFYTTEGVFQDDVISQAVDTVTADGAIYLSSAGNAGNLNDGTSGVWEGDFVSIAAPALVGGTAHDFGGGTNFNTITADTNISFDLKWSDPLGASNNDYDLYMLNAALTAVVAASTGAQNGTQDPIERIGSNAVNHAGNVLMVVPVGGPANRFLHVNANRGRLAISTAGQIFGHPTVPAAFAVAAVDVATAGGSAFTGGAANPVETFSSDGPRRVFYDAAGNPLTPGDVSSTGGVVRPKPDIAAADGVATATPGFNPFFGTSAAAPHAAAIVALMLSANPAITPAQVRSILTATALDIEATGFDRDSGFGIVSAFTGVSAALCGDPSCGTNIDHYKCYQARETPGTTKFVPQNVSLMDQFETVLSSNILRPRSICNPVSKNGAPILDDTAHLTCYTMKDDRGQIGKFQNRTVEVTNQLGVQQLQIKSPHQLCVPTEKGIAPNPPVPSNLAIDHYRCYKAKPLKGSYAPQEIVTLADQFQDRLALTSRCLRFCNPVAKNGAPILDPSAHLTCYKLYDLSTDPPTPLVNVNTTNQFGDLTLRARTMSAEYLCVPSLKVLLP